MARAWAINPPLCAGRVRHRCRAAALGSEVPLERLRFGEASQPYTARLGRQVESRRKLERREHGRAVGVSPVATRDGSCRIVVGEPGSAADRVAVLRPAGEADADLTQPPTRPEQRRRTLRTETIHAATEILVAAVFCARLTVVATGDRALATHEGNTLVGRA